MVDAFFYIPADLFARDDRLAAHAPCRRTRSRRPSKYSLSADDVVADAAPPSNRPRIGEAEGFATQDWLAIRGQCQD